jgi:hypothetical protein
MLRRVFWEMLANVSEILTASIIRVPRQHGAVSQETAIFILAAVRT